MSGLALIVTDRARMAGGLRLAAAAAALGRPVSMLFDGDTVGALVVRAPAPWVTEALAMGVQMTACQTGMAEAGIDAPSLLAGVETGGLIGYLAAVGDAQLILL
jgi:predicted peroxiredoxin